MLCTMKGFKKSKDCYVYIHVSELLMTERVVKKTITHTDVGRCTSEPRHCYKVPLFGMFSQRHKSRTELQLKQMLWMGAREMVWTLKSSTVSEKKWLDLRQLFDPIVLALINLQHQHPHHLYPLIRLPNRSVTTASSTSFISKVTESGTSWQN